MDSCGTFKRQIARLRVYGGFRYYFVFLLYPVFKRRYFPFLGFP